MIACDAEDRISFMNPAAEVLTGWSLGEAGGRPIADVFRLIGEATGRPIEWPRAGAGPVEGVLLVRRDGRMLPIDDSISPITDEAGRRTGTVVVFRSVDERRRAEEALRRSEEQLQALFNQAAVGIAQLDLSGRFAMVNRRYCEIVGRPVAEIMGSRPHDLIDPEDRPLTEAAFREVAGGGPDCRIEKRHVRQDGSAVWTSENISLVRDATGLPRSIVTICQDITDRTRAEEELRRAHAELERRVGERTAELAEANAALQGEIAERSRAEEELQRANQALRALIQASPLPTIALDAQGRVTLWNPAAERTFGWGEREVLGRPLPAVPEGLRREFSAGLAASLRGEAHAGHETRRLKQDGAAIEISLWTAPLYDARGEPCGRMGVVEDITERRRAEEARTALLRRIVTAQEEERLRIARELHDQMGQHLAALMLGLRAAIDHIRDPEAAKEARRLHDLANRIGQEVHRVALELRPTALDDWGLQTALTNYAAEWSRRARIPVQSRFVGIDRRRLPPPVETALYRTVQEALTNVLKHARAGRVSLIVERRPDHVARHHRGRRPGLRRRGGHGRAGRRGEAGPARDAGARGAGGGALVFESRPGGGTSLFIRIPLADAGEEADLG